MIQPHFYQSDCLMAVRKVRERKLKTALVVMASGLGKTVTAAFDVKSFREEHSKARVLYLCHQNHILHKACQTFEAINGNADKYGFYTGLVKTDGPADFLFASLHTMRKNLEKFKPDEFDYVVVDESHHTYADTFLDVVTYWKPKFLLGMTATPDRTDNQDIRKVFGREVFYLPIDEALSLGLLTPVDYRLMSDEIELGQLLRTPERRLSISKLNRTIFVRRRDEEIVKLIRLHSKDVANPRIIIFCQSVEYCDRLAKLIDGAVPFHSKVPVAERIVRMELFRQGVISVLLTVDMFNEGIDIPPANLLVFLRSTMSPIVLLQQLGRGLRLSEGKDKVVVLDFVGNCERVKTILELWESVKARLQRFDPPKARKAPRLRKRRVAEEPFLLNTDYPGFQEKILKVMEVVRRVTDGYSREECIAMLKAFADELGRSPTQLEVQRNKHMPSPAVYAKIFGTHSDALVAAGLVLNQMRELTRGELLMQLRKIQKELGHPPSQDEVAEASRQGKCACEPVFRNHFGSLTKALQQIGFKPTRYVGLSKKQLCEQLRELRAKLKRQPTVDDVIAASARDEMASYSAFNTRFGSWSKALRAAFGRKVKVAKRQYTRGELLCDIRVARIWLGHDPNTPEMGKLIRQKKVTARSLTPFYTEFGTLAKACRVAKRSA
ncbi:MAG: DEAD/DEAH box helicase family protein [Patescibacteria group bacterium]|nr:DEAD/DEAH box helicase family protein [Patescibacteria group bacterium]MDE2116579.1 DEAD/DEAH box helicase family protein [Patescibacteria group bacterium]